MESAPGKRYFEREYGNIFMEHIFQIGTKLNSGYTGELSSKPWSFMNGGHDAGETAVTAVGLGKARGLEKL